MTRKKKTVGRPKLDMEKNEVVITSIFEIGFSEGLNNFQPQGVRQLRLFCNLSRNERKTGSCNMQ